MEEEREPEKSILITPYNKFVRKNLLSTFDNLEDSGFHSATPSSREQSYQTNYDCSFNKSNEDAHTDTTEHDKTVYMDCEESFYSDPMATLPFTPSPIVMPSVVAKSRRIRLPKRKNLNGFEHVDILYFLGHKYNFSRVVSKILSYLPVSDLLNVTAVSKTWRNVCNNDLQARKKLQEYKTNRDISKENFNKYNVELLGRHSGRPLLSDISNVQNTSTPLTHLSSVDSPRTQRFKLFCKEGGKLDKKSKLMQCPRCTLPARCTAGSNLGQCLCSNCQYKFCSNCLRDYHNLTRCQRISSCPSTRIGQCMVIGSKASKRRLSRT